LKSCATPEASSPKARSFSVSDKALPQALGLGHVHEQTLGGGAALILDAAPAKLQVSYPPLRVLAQHFGGARRLPALPCGDASGGQGGRRRIEDSREPKIGMHHIFGGNAERLGERAVDEPDGVLLHDQDRVGGRLDERLVLHRRFLERLHALANLTLERRIQALEGVLERAGLARLLLEAIGHRVERPCQVGKLLRPGYGYAVLQLSGGQRLRPGREAAKRGGDSACEPAHAQHGDEREEQPQQHELDAQPPELGGDDVVLQPDAHASPRRVDAVHQNRHGDLDDANALFLATRQSHVDVSRSGHERRESVRAGDSGGAFPAIPATAPSLS
jgi:hypothetical protein